MKLKIAWGLSPVLSHDEVLLAVRRPFLSEKNLFPTLNLWSMRLTISLEIRSPSCTVQELWQHRKTTPIDLNFMREWATNNYRVILLRLLGFLVCACMTGCLSSALITYSHRVTPDNVIQTIPDISFRVHHSSLVTISHKPACVSRESHMDSNACTVCAWYAYASVILDVWFTLRPRSAHTNKSPPGVTHVSIAHSVVTNLE